MAETRPTNGIERIASERVRQVHQEGWTPEHDDEHDEFELSSAACAYALAAKRAAKGHPLPEPVTWPDDWRGWWKPSTDPIRNLEKAGALIAAEIDRLIRAQEGE